MAFLDIFEEQRKKLNNYFGLGQPGLGTFGKQVSNVIKPTVSKNIQNYQKAGRYLSSQPTLAQRFTPVVGPARSLVNLRRDLRNPQSLQRQAIAGAGKSVGDIANFAQKVNLPNQLANRLLPQKMTSQYNVGQFRNLIARQPQATTTAGKVARFGGEMLPYFAIPGGGSANYGSQAFRGLSKATPNVLTKAALTNAAKIAGRKELLANIGREAVQGAGFMGSTAIGQNKSPKEIAKDILIGAGFGAGARLGMAGAGAVVGKVADKVKLQQAINSIKNPELRLQVNKEIGLLQSKPAFAKLPINPKKPSQPIVGANKGIDALRAEARKYKSAEEFVKAQGTPVYHGGEISKLENKPLFTAVDDYIAKSYDPYGKLNEFYPNKNLKELDITTDYSKVKEAIKSKFDNYGENYVENTWFDPFSSSKKKVKETYDKYISKYKNFDAIEKRYNTLKDESVVSKYGELWEKDVQKAISYIRELPEVQKEKVFEFDILDRVIKEVKDPSRDDVYANWKQILKYAKDNKYDSVKHITQSKDAQQTGIERIFIDPTKSIKTKSQLTDIWNKSQSPTPKTSKIPLKDDAKIPIKVDALSNEARKVATDKRGLKLKNPYGGDLPTNPDGTITVYHSTTPESAQKIAQEGIKGSKVEGGNIYFTTDPKGYSNIGKGKNVVLQFNVDPSKVEFDDVYRGTLHLKSNNADIQGLKPLSPQSTQGAGKPIVAYHGTASKFDNFDMSKSGLNNARTSKLGVWFTNDQQAAKEFADTAKAYAGKGGQSIVRKDTLNLKNPLVIEGKNGQDSFNLFRDELAKFTQFEKPNYNLHGRQIEMQGDKINYDGFRKYLSDQGYDGIIIKNTEFDAPKGKKIDQILVLDPKSVQPSTQGATTPLKVNKPQKGIRLPLKDKKATERLGTGVVGGEKGIVEPQLNTSKFDISEQAKKNLNETVASIKPELEKVKGGVLKNEDVVDAAKASKILTREVDPAKTKQATAAITRLRQEVAAGAEGKGLTKDFIENLKVLKSYSADAGRKLQAFNIKASPETSIKESVIADLVGLGKKSDDLIKAAKGVDFDNPKQVSKFYRQFVKPSLGEVLDEYRYINLLSSPQTHIVNAFSNLIQGTVLNPATKLYTGAIDSIGSRLTGKQRTAYVREVPAYSKGFINSMGDAFREASEVMKGNKFVERPDINRLPTGKLGPGEYVSRALEAGDVFFRRMIKGGEMEALAYKASRSGKKVPQSVMEKQAADAAEYFVFRKAPDPSNKTGQGAVLSGIDKATEAVYKFRNVPGVKWVIPFVQTPMNILKQGLEYSPLGVSTLVGSTNKTQQLAKALIGSTVLAGAATLESTWDAPTSKNEKEEFYASGRKPYSVKIGDNWVSYSRLGPLAYPMAMAAAVKWYFDNDPKATSTDSIEKTTKLLGGIAGFFSDQSYLSGIGDLVSVAKGEDYAIKGMLANFGKQLVPLTSLQGWVARQLDPIYRQPKTITEQIKAGIPGLSKSIDPYTDPLGNPSKRENLPFNAWSPVNVNPANQQFEDIYQKRQLQKRSDAEAKALTSGTKQLSDGRVAMIINDEVRKFDSQEEANLEIAKDEFKKSGKNIQQYEDKVFRLQSDGDVKVQDKIDYDYSLNTNKLQRLKSSKDYKGWVETANKQLEILDKQLKDPTLDELEQSDLLEKADKILSDMAKYSEYGGFDKPKKGKKINISVPDLGSAKIPVKRAGKFAFKTSSAPKINIVSTKPKQITKSYLASIR